MYLFCRAYEPHRPPLGVAGISSFRAVHSNVLKCVRGIPHSCNWGHQHVTEDQTQKGIPLGLVLCTDHLGLLLTLPSKFLAKFILK